MKSLGGMVVKFCYDGVARIRGFSRERYGVPINGDNAN